jgi:hypothetical protein
MGVGSSKSDDDEREEPDATTVSTNHNVDSDASKDDEENSDYEQDMEESEGESSAELSEESAQEENEPDRRPGLIPFTSVAIDNSFSDDLLENALVCSWLSRRAVFERRPTDRWCALHQNFIYELEDEFGQMVLKERVNLKGSICYIDEGKT